MITARGVETNARMEPITELLSHIGQTPLFRLRRITRSLPEAVEVYAKLEWYNPGGSVKDRPASAIIQRALDSGDLRAGRILLDATSGNMGIAYATLGAALGIPVSLAIPSNASRERIAILRALGAGLTLTDPSEGSDGARLVAAEMYAREPDRYFYADQYSNPANWQAHYRTTGPEVADQTGARITHFVAGAGTTGTITGAGRYLHQALPDTRVVAVQPEGPLHGLEGLKHLPTSLIPAIYDPTVADGTEAVATEEAYAMARRLAREEGLFVGVSAAAAAVASLRIALRLKAGVIVAIFPDSGMKYLDAAFWGEP
jgi:cysteine synthase B